MIRNQRWSSLRPVEFTIAGVALAILASAAAPTQVPNQIAANEAAAIEALRTIAAAQAEFKAAVDTDTNCDGVGEYGYLGELTGRVPMRVGVGLPCTPAAGGSFSYLSPPLLRSAFQHYRDRCVMHAGYLFQLWLPAARVSGRVSGIPEDPSGGKVAAPFPDPVNGAGMWCCYAWPINYDGTGRRAFFINQRGEVLQDSNQGHAPFTRLSVRPSFDEAYSVSGDMGSPLRIGIPNANGSVWWPVP